VASAKKKSARPARVEVQSATTLAGLPWLVHGFSTRPGGVSTAYGVKSLNLGFTRDDPRRNVERNRELFLRALQVDFPIVTSRQIHSDIVNVVDAAPSGPLAGDALVTATPGLLLAVKTADCTPVLLVDAKKKVVAAVHAGWRSTAQRIVEKTVGVMRQRFGSRPGDLRAAIGPGIRQCCYEVGEEVRDRFRSQFAYADELFREAKESDPVREKYPMLFLTARAPGHADLGRQIFLDLAEAARRQLLDAGLPAKHISALDACTACHPELYFSHRAQHGRTGRMLGTIGIRK
jgi:YfiH family protein